MAAQENRPFAWPAGKRAGVSLSFDDARLSQVDRGLGVLGAAGAKATFYVSPSAVRERLDGWRAAVAAGHEIGNHTMNHPCSGNFAFARSKALESYTLERMEDELLDANDEVARLLGVTPATFAYPCGQTFVGRGADVHSYVPLVAGRFLAGRAAFNETCNDPAYCDLAQLFGRDGDAKSPAELRAMVDQAVESGGWLILFGHEIGPEAGKRQTTNETALAELCEYCLRRRGDIWLDTVAAIGQYVKDEHARTRSES